MPLVEPPSPLHRVHFETTCVVIPEHPEQSGIHFEKHSIPLPIWRRARPDAKPDAPPPVITVRVPSLSRKHRRRESLEPERPLQPCLRHSHSVSCSNTGSRMSTSSQKSLTDRRSAPTGEGDRIPLRECCPACLDAVMKGLQTDYHEHYSKGALRRRRASESSADPPSTSTSSAFLATAVIDEVDARRAKKHPNAPKCLPPMVLNTLCADADDEALLFPLPSPRRTPCSGTPLGTPPKSSSQGSRTPSPRRPPSPRGLAKALSETESRHRPAPKLVTIPEPTGHALIAQYPDVDLLPEPSHSPSRRAASDSAVPSASKRSTSSSPTTRRPSHSLFRAISPPSFTGW